MERTETGYRLPCVCGTPSCSAHLDVETFPAQDIAILSIDEGIELPFRLSALRRILAEGADAPSGPLSAPSAAEQPHPRGSGYPGPSEAISGPCCDMHNQHCEPPANLCCGRCTETTHDSFPVSHADGSRCGRPDHDCDRGHLAAVVIDGGEEFAERICALLNGDEQGPRAYAEPSVEGWEDVVGFHDQQVRAALLLVGPDVGTDATADSCTIHRGRWARGCDGSGRTCPRHGAVL